MITLSMPRTAPGEAQIRARGPRLDAIVGDCVRIGSSWKYTLWSTAGQRAEGDETGRVWSLKDLRKKLEPRVNSDGPWWQ